MKRYLEFYDEKKTYIAPSYEEFTPSYVASHYAIVNAGKCVIETNSTGKMFYSVTLLEIMRDMHDIDESLTDDEALLAIQEIINIPPVDNTDATADERIASALEYQNLMTL